MDPQDIAALIDPAAEWRYRRQLCREAYDRGYAEAWEAGRRALLEELATAQRIACGPARVALAEPTHAALETLRWGPGGREHFSGPRPGDFMPNGSLAGTHKTERAA